MLQINEILTEVDSLLQQKHEKSTETELSQGKNVLFLFRIYFLHLCHTKLTGHLTFYL